MKWLRGGSTNKHIAGHREWYSETMTPHPPSALHVHSAITNLMRWERDADPSLRCQLVYDPNRPTYTVWSRGPLRESVGAALASELGRPFAQSEDYWTLELSEAETLLKTAIA